ncbi:large with signal peptide [Cryptosporidium sp. chipmunk genotype I]|uniref:large with signal peptide n=1 Tax=Cryptosporidium sp. chipmunk genotype I TaxID=1280935 RepID=UPI00351A862C|nr:large with signal peptide [Cryptosporidium sp. chipmunk genotype I]
MKKNFLKLLNLIFLGRLLLANLVFCIDGDNEQIRQALESRSEDITELSDFWNCISTQVIRDKFSWNRVHRIGRYDSMPIVFPSIMKEQLQSIDIVDPRKFYLGCIGALKLLEAKRIIIPGYEDELEKSYSRKTFCISAAEYCYPVKGRLDVVKDYFTKVAEKAREAILESKEKQINDREKEEIQKLADREDLKLLQEDPDHGKPQHHPLMEERIRSKRIEKNKVSFPELGKDLELQLEFLETGLEEIPLKVHRVKGGDEIVRTGIDYESLSKVSLYNLPPDSVNVSKGAWNFWKSILLQESRDQSIGNKRISISSQSFPVELAEFTYNPRNLLKLCNLTLFSLLKQGLLDVSDSALNKSKESPIVQDAEATNEEKFQEFLKFKSLDADQPDNPEKEEMDYIHHQFVIFQFCTDSVDIFIGNRQWSKIIERQNYRIYGLPSGRPFMPFKFKFGRDIYEMRNNCAGCIWDLYVNKVSKDLYIDGNTKSGKFDITLVKKNIESFCHFASVAFFQGELSLDDQQSSDSSDNNSRKGADSAHVYNPKAYDFERKKQEEEEKENYEQVRPEKHQFLAQPLDDEVYQVSLKTSPTGYHEFKSNESLNRSFMEQQKNSRRLFGATRSVDEILNQGVPIGLTVGDTNQKTLKYESIYKISPKESLVAFQQWKAITFQMVTDARNNIIPSISELPLDQPREWNTPQYSSEKFLFVCFELIGSLLSQSKAKINLPHGAELDNFQNKAKDTIKIFCRDATNRYFQEYNHLFDVISASSKREPLMDENKVSSKWSIVQEQVIIDYISGLENRITEISPLPPNDFYPATEKLDFEYQCISAIYNGYTSVPPRVLISTKLSEEQGKNEEAIKNELNDLITSFCKRASDRYYTAVEYITMYNESKNWLDPMAKSPYSISSHLPNTPGPNKSGSIQGIPWPPIKSPLSLVFNGRARPDLYRDDCFSYLWRVWESGIYRNLYIDGTNFEKCKSLDMAKVILEEFCTISSVKLFKLAPEVLPQRNVLSMEQKVLVGVHQMRKKIKRTENDVISDDLPKNERKNRVPSPQEPRINLSDMDEYSESDINDGQESDVEEEEFKSSEKKEAKRQWDQLKQQLKRDINMNYIRFVKLPKYDQTLYTLWPSPVPELVFTEHCIKVLDELLKLRLAVISSHNLNDREYTIERFCEESKFYVFSDIKEKTNDELKEYELGYEGDPEGVGRKIQQELLDTLKELSDEGYPLYKWMESVMNLKNPSDRETLYKAIKWGQRKGDWHFLGLLLREIDKETFMSIQRHLQGISPQGFLMTSGLFDKDTTVSIEATWGAIYLQSLKDIKSGNPRIVGLIGSPPPREIWSGANNEQEFVLLCTETLKKLKTNPPFISFNSQGQGERGYLQNFCEDALDTLISLQREPEKVLSMDFSYSGCVNESMRKWQWNQIYIQMDIDLKELGGYRITGIPPTISHKIFKGGKTVDEVEDQCGDALEELDKRNKIKILNKNASQFCKDAAENICKEDETGKSNCNIERVRLEEMISEYYMETPIGNPLKLDSRTRCMRIWTLIRNSVPSAIKNNILSTYSTVGVNGAMYAEMDMDMDLGFGGEIALPGMNSFMGNNHIKSEGILSTALDGNIRFIVLKEIMDVCSPIDTPNHIIGVFIKAMRKIQKINSLKSSDEGLYNWIRELVIRYLADERTDNEYFELTGVNVFGDPYSKDDNALDMLNKGLHSRGIPKRVRELTDNEKLVIREKDNMRINSLVEGIVSQVLPSIAHLTTKEKKREITDQALLKLQKDTEERDLLLNNQIGNSEILDKIRAGSELPVEERNSIALGKVSIPILSGRTGRNGDNMLYSSKGSSKIVARLDTRWNKVGSDDTYRFKKIRDQEKASKALSKNMERNYRKLDSEWLSIRTFKSYVLLNLPKDRPSEYGDKGFRDAFNKETMIRRCVNFFTDEKNIKNYKISIKGNYIERLSHIRIHCTRSASRTYELASRSSSSGNNVGIRIKSNRGKAVHRAGRLIHVEGEKEPLHQIVSKQRIISGNVIEDSEISPEELENSEPPTKSQDYPFNNIEVQHVGSNDGYKAISSEYVSRRSHIKGKNSNRRKK